MERTEKAPTFKYLHNLIISKTLIDSIIAIVHISSDLYTINEHFILKSYKTLGRRCFKITKQTDSIL